MELLLSRDGGMILKKFIEQQSLVNKRIIVKDLSRLGTIIEDGSKNKEPYVVVKLDSEPQYILKCKIDEIVIIGEVQSNNNQLIKTNCG